MALNKPIATDFGVSASYWNIGAAQEDFKGGGVHLTLYGYVDEAARQAGKQPLVSGQVQLIGEHYVPEAGRAAWYKALKALPEWEGAEDI